MTALPYLEGETRDAFDAWAEERWQSYVPPLTFTEVRKGLQALERVYAAQDVSPVSASRATEGLGKRAALATYFAQRRFITTHHATDMVVHDDPVVRRIVDLGCGTGATGAALARALPGNPRVLGIDSSGFMLDEARRTWDALGISARAERGSLPASLPRIEHGDLLAAGWTLSEMSTEERERLLKRIEAALKRGARTMILERLTDRPPRWWRAWRDRLAARGVSEEVIRVAIDRPRRIRELDKAARLDTQVVSAAVLYGGTAR